MGTHMNPNAPNHLDLSAAGNGDDFFDQMLCAIPSWDLVNQSGFDESSILVSRLRQYQIDGGDGGSPAPAGKQSIRQAASDLDSALLMPLPLSLGHCSNSDSSFKSPIPAIAEGLYSGFVGGSLQGSATQPQHFHQPQGGTMPQQNFGGAPPATVAAPRPRVRARRGQATDPHSIAERLRRERIAERMKALQELVPNANKTDKASMLDEIIDYVKFLQLQVKVLSMSRLGGAAAVAPLIADISSEGGAPAGRGLPGATAASENMSATERQVAKLMEEDMGSAMQYLQGKGLCLMPISLASAISTATCRGPNPGLLASFVAGISPGADISPSSPSLSVLTVQSAVAAGSADTGKDGAASVSSK